MATYHVTAEPRPGEYPRPGTCPLVSADFMAASERDALGQAQSIIDEWTSRASEHAPVHAGGGEDDDDGPLFREMEKWRPVALFVDRPAVNLRPYAVEVPVLRDGEPVGTHYDYGRENGTESFLVLVDGVVQGHLRRRRDDVSGNRVWFIDGPAGPLEALAERRWNDYSETFQPGAERWLDGALGDIRAALMRKQ